MNQLVNRYYNTFDRVDEFGRQLGVPVPPRVTILLGGIADARDAIQDYAASQEGGANDFRAGTGDRSRVATELREMLVEISGVARTLDQVQYPEAAELVRVTKSKGYQALRATADAFVAAVTPISAAFIERGFPETFVADLQSRIDALDAGGQRKHGGSRERIESTAGLGIVSQRGLRLVRELDAILRKKLKKSDPAKWAAWKAASRVQRAPVPAPPIPTPTPQPAATTPTV